MGWDMFRSIMVPIHSVYKRLVRNWNGTVPYGITFIITFTDPFPCKRCLFLDRVEYQVIFYFTMLVGRPFHLLALADEMFSQFLKETAFTIILVSNNT